MILSNLSILEALRAGTLMIEGLAGLDPSKAPFNTSSVDLRLGSTLVVPGKLNEPLDLRKTYPGNHLLKNSTTLEITEDSPYLLEPYTFVLGKTIERVALPLQQNKPCFSARVEGKSSRARFGLAVHITAPTIHNEFSGSITLEMMNFGPNPILLHPGVFICQLIVEEVDKSPFTAPNQFTGQSTPVGAS